MFHFGYPPMGGGSFEATYRAFPLAFIDKQSAEYGDKVILPPSALDRLASLHIEYPMLFKVENLTTGRSTHCGVLEFVAQEGHVYLPRWMMHNLLLTEGQAVKFRNMSLPKGTYVKLQPVTSDFLDISNPKAVLERALRAYSCLTVGDCFVINYNSTDYEIEVRETKPGSAVSIIETDCQTDFEAPKDYKEPERPPPIVRPPPADPMQEDKPAGDGSGDAEEPEEPSFVAFVGAGRRLDGKPSTSSGAPPPAAASAAAAAAARRQASSSASATNGSGASSSGGAGGSGSGSGKAGTFVSTGNRLLDKLQKDGKLAPPTPPPPPVEAEGEDKDKGPSFEAFKGKGYRLK